jgi:uncharacterized small protein (DUF1192 family)
MWVASYCGPGSNGDTMTFALIIFIVLLLFLLIAAATEAEKQNRRNTIASEEYALLLHKYDKDIATLHDDISRLKVAQEAKNRKVSRAVDKLLVVLNDGMPVHVNWSPDITEESEDM